jgi:hypothetical protein
LASERARSSGVVFGTLFFATVFLFEQMLDLLDVSSDVREREEHSRHL